MTIFSKWIRTKLSRTEDEGQRGGLIPGLVPDKQPISATTSVASVDESNENDDAPTTNEQSDSIEIKAQAQKALMRRRRPEFSLPKLTLQQLEELYMEVPDLQPEEVQELQLLDLLHRQQELQQELERQKHLELEHQHRQELQELILQRLKETKKPEPEPEPEIKKKKKLNNTTETKVIVNPREDAEYTAGELVKSTTTSPETTSVLQDSVLRNSNVSRSSSSRRAFSTTTSTVLIAMTIFSMTTNALEITLSTEKEYDLDAREYDPSQATDVFFTAYDCINPALEGNSSRPEIRAIDLTKIEECPDPVHHYEEPTNETVILLQSNVPVLFNVTHCVVKMSTQLGWHGMHSHNIRDDAIGDNVPVKIGQTMCNTMWETKTFTVPSALSGGGVASPEKVLEPNEHNTIEWYTHGGYREDQSVFEGSFQYTTNGVKKEMTGHRHVIVSVFIEKIQAQRDIDTNRVWSEKGKFQGQYNLGSAWSVLEGSFAWEVEVKPPCDDSYAILAETSATVHKKKRGFRAAGDQIEFAEAMLIIRNETAQRAAGYVLKTTSPVCFPDCFYTNVPYVIACLSNKSRSDVAELVGIDSRPPSRVLRLNLQSMGTYLELTTRLSAFETHKRLSEEMCRESTRGIQRDFASLLNSNNQYAIHGLTAGDNDKIIMGEDQDDVYSMSVRGSVAYFLKCSPIKVQLIQLPICIQQMPVILPDKRLGFVDSINLHLIEIPRKVECTRAMPVQYRIMGSLYCHSPEHGLCPRNTEPTIIKPDVGSAQGIRPSQFPVLGGLVYTDTQLESLTRERARQTMGEVAGQIIVDRAIDNTLDQSGRASTFYLGIPLTDFGITFVKDKIASKMFFLFRVFGQAYLHLFGFTVIATMLSHFMGCIIRFYYIYHIRGCGVWMLKALGASIFAVGMLPSAILQSTIRTAKETLIEAKDDAMPPPQYDEALDRLAALERSFQTYRVDAYRQRQERDQTIGMMHTFEPHGMEMGFGTYDPYVCDAGPRHRPTLAVRPRVVTQPSPGPPQRSQSPGPPQYPRSSASTTTSTPFPETYSSRTSSDQSFSSSPKSSCSPPSAACHAKQR